MAGVGDCPRGATGPKPGSLSPGDGAPSGRWARLPGSPRGHRAVTSLGCVPTPSRLTLDYLPDRTPSCSARDAKSPSSRREWSRGTCPVPRRHGGGAPKRPPRTSQPRALSHCAPPPGRGRPSTRSMCREPGPGRPLPTWPPVRGPPSTAGCCAHVCTGDAQVHTHLARARGVLPLTPAAGWKPTLRRHQDGGDG